LTTKLEECRSGGGGFVDIIDELCERSALEYEAGEEGADEMEGQKKGTKGKGRGRNKVVKRGKKKRDATTHSVSDLERLWKYRDLAKTSSRLGAEPSVARLEDQIVAKEKAIEALRRERKKKRRTKSGEEEYREGHDE
jgi:hypothetical protein